MPGATDSQRAADLFRSLERLVAVLARERELLESTDGGALKRLGCKRQRLATAAGRQWRLLQEDGAPEDAVQRVAEMAAAVTAAMEQNRRAAAGLREASQKGLRQVRVGNRKIAEGYFHRDPSMGGCFIDRRIGGRK